MQVPRPVFFNPKYAVKSFGLSTIFWSEYYKSYVLLYLEASPSPALPVPIVLCS